MSEKRKISLRKILQSIVTLIVMTGCTIAILSATKQQRKRTLKGIVVNIQNNEYGFIDKDEVEKILLTSKKISLSQVSIEKLDVLAMEDTIRKNHWINSAQVYVDNDKMLHVDVVQRVPVVRLFEVDGDSYYLDTSRKRVPLSQRYVFDAMIFTNIPKLKKDTASENIKAQVLKLSDHIVKDSFWKEQITQVIYNEGEGFELVPVLGKHRILIGDTSMLNTKFTQLYSFYKNVLNRIGWDKYEVLDVRYKGQLVASPSMPWNVPQDRVRAKINWVSSITGLPPTPITIPSLPNTMRAKTVVDEKTSTTGASKPDVVQPQADEAPFPERQKKQKTDGQNDNKNNDKVDEQKDTKEQQQKKKVIPKYIYQGAN